MLTEEHAVNSRNYPDIPYTFVAGDERTLVLHVWYYGVSVRQKYTFVVVTAVGPYTRLDSFSAGVLFLLLLLGLRILGVRKSVLIGARSESQKA